MAESPWRAEQGADTHRVQPLRHGGKVGRPRLPAEGKPREEPDALPWIWTPDREHTCVA